MKFTDQLVKFGACEDAVKFSEDKTAQQAWDTCKRGDWMMWLMKKKYPNKTSLAIRKKLVLVACDCAETSLKYLPKDEKRPAEAIKLAKAWATGVKVKIEDIENAAYAAYAAANADNAAYAANAA